MKCFKAQHEIEQPSGEESWLMGLTTAGDLGSFYEAFVISHKNTQHSEVSGTRREDKKDSRGEKNVPVLNIIGFLLLNVLDFYTFLILFLWMEHNL